MKQFDTVSYEAPWAEVLEVRTEENLMQSTGITSTRGQGYVFGGSEEWGDE